MKKTFKRTEKPLAEYDQVHPVYEQIRVILRNDDRTIETISRETGLPMNWVALYSSGRCVNPAFSRVAHLYKYLTGKEISL